MLADLAISAVARPARLRELAGELALRIVRTGDKGPEPAAAQRQTANAALRALARIVAVALVREQVVGQELVKRLGHFGRLALHDFVGLRLEVLPELGEKDLPLLAPARDVVEFVFHPGGEVIGNIARKEPL